MPTAIQAKFTKCHNSTTQQTLEGPKF